MRIPRASRSLVGALLMTPVLTGCFGAHFAPETPKGVELQGVWRLNRTASDDPQKVIDTLRAEALKKLRRAMNPGCNGSHRCSRNSAELSNPRLISVSTAGDQKSGFVAFGTSDSLLL